MSIQKECGSRGTGGTSLDQFSRAWRNVNLQTGGMSQARQSSALMRRPGGCEDVKSWKKQVGDLSDRSCSRKLGCWSFDRLQGEVQGLC